MSRADVLIESSIIAGEQEEFFYVLTLLAINPLKHYKQCFFTLIPIFFSKGQLQVFGL